MRFVYGISLDTRLGNGLHFLLLLPVYALICSLFYSQPIFAQNKGAPAGTIPESVYRTLVAFLIDAQHYTHLPEDKKRLLNQQVFTNKDYGGVKRGHLPKNKQLIVGHLRNYIISKFYLLESYDVFEREKKWFLGQNWQRDVRPFFNGNNMPFAYASDLSRIGYALRFMTLILGSEQAVIEHFNELDPITIYQSLHQRFGPTQLWLDGYGFISSELATSTNLGAQDRKLIDEQIKKIMTLQFGQMRDYLPLKGGPYWLFMNHKVAHIPLDTPQDCNLEIENSKPTNQVASELAHLRLSELLDKRQVRNQIGDTCYANLAAELVDIHRLFAIFREQNANDLPAIRSLIDSDNKYTSAFYAAGLYSLMSNRDVTTFDFGFETATAELLIRKGACPMSP